MSSRTVGTAEYTKMNADGAIIGVWDHWGWAALVTVSRETTVLDRRRVVLVDSELPAWPHHHDAQTLPLEQAVELVERVRASADRHARLGLDAVANAVRSPIRGIAIRECPRLPPTIAERLRDYQSQNVADSVMYRMALAGAAESRGWPVYWYHAKKVLAEAGGALRVADLETHFAEARRSLGSPWGQDQKVAMAAAIAAAAREDARRP